MILLENEVHCFGENQSAIPRAQEAETWCYKNLTEMSRNIQQQTDDPQTYIICPNTVGNLENGYDVIDNFLGASNIKVWCGKTAVEATTVR